MSAEAAKLMMMMMMRLLMPEPVHPTTAAAAGLSRSDLHCSNPLQHNRPQLKVSKQVAFKA